MSEYWKSNAKKYCDYCKVWIQDNKASINIHESGYKHKQNVKAKLDEIKKNADKKRHEEKKMSESMAAIERAAMESMRNDLATNPSLRKQYGSAPSTSSSIEIPKKNQETIKPKSAEKKVSDKKSTDNKTAVKRKSNNNLPESKMGKWQTVEEKKPEPVQKPGFIDLQLPTVVKKPLNKSLLNCFAVNPNLNKNNDQEEKPSIKEEKEEIKNKWVPVSFAPVEEETNKNECNNSNIIEHENQIGHVESNETIHSRQDDIPKPELKPLIKSEKIEIPDLSTKKEKVISFKKRKVDSNQLRSRTEDD